MDLWTPHQSDRVVWGRRAQRERCGISIRDVVVKTMPFPEMVAALENGAVHCGTLTEPFATAAEEKGAGVRPFQAKPGAKPVPITVIFWNSDWAKKNDPTARGFMLAFLRAVRDPSGVSAWREPVNLEVIHKHTRVPIEVLKKTRPPFFDQNLELDEKVMMDQQDFNLRLGYLKYSAPKPIRE